MRQISLKYQGWNLPDNCWTWLVFHQKILRQHFTQLVSKSDVEVKDYYDYGNIETSQTPLQYKYTTKADVDDDEDFSDEYLLKQEDEEVREHSRFPSELRNHQIIH